MAKIVSQVVFDYLDELQQSLQLPREAAQAIVAEVRSDLMEHVHRHVNDGCNEEQATELALAEMGPPAELAAAMRSVVPPLGGPLVQYLRYFAAAILVLFCLMIFWNARAMSFGISWLRMSAIAAVLLPLLLITWPQVIWRRNWMFTSVPVVVVLLAIFLLFSTGTSQTTIPVVDAGADATPVTHVADNTWLNVTRWIALGLMSALTVYLLIMMQRRVQRMAALLVAILAIAAVEAPYAIEEYYYAQQLERIQTMLADHKKQHGEVPTEEEFDILVTWDGIHYGVARDRRNYTLLWDRKLSPGYALCYASRDNRRWVND